MVPWCRMAEASEADLTFLNHLGQHLGLLAVEYVYLDKEGQTVGELRRETCSGFFVELDSKW
jgi:hypothetical protein